MYKGYPRDLIALLLCPEDHEKLVLLQTDLLENENRIIEGTLTCTCCKRSFKILDGIIHFLDAEFLDTESKHECTVRNEEAVIYDTLFDKIFDKMEIQPSIESLEPLEGMSFLELGCGTGRYTEHLMERANTMILIDFSVQSLKQLALKLSPQANIGLILADVTKLHFVPNSFDRIFSTLVSNLPSPQHVDKLFKLASDVLKDDGCFCFSTHYYGLRNIIGKTPKKGRYNGDGIFFNCYRKSDIQKQIRNYFSKTDYKRIQVVPPFVRRFNLPLFTVSRFSECIPIINEFAQLMLVKAIKPIKNMLAAICLLEDQLTQFQDLLVSCLWLL